MTPNYKDSAPDGAALPKTALAKIEAVAAAGLVGRLSSSATATAGDSRPTNPTLSKSDIAKIEAVAAAGREFRRVRAEALTKLKGGLRALYRTLELPGAKKLVTEDFVRSNR